MGPLIISIRREGFGISTLSGHIASICLHEKTQPNIKLLLLSPEGGSVEQHSQQFKVRGKDGVSTQRDTEIEREPDGTQRRRSGGHTKTGSL